LPAGRAAGRGIRKQRFSQCVWIGMRSQTMSVCLILCAAVICGSGVNASELNTAEVNHKLSLAAARGELTNRQVIAFRSEIQNAKTQIALTRLAQSIDRARKPKRIATKLFGLF